MADSGGGKKDAGQPTADTGRMTKIRGNPQYVRPMPGGPPRRHAETDAGQTATDVGGAPKTKENPQ